MEEIKIQQASNVEESNSVAVDGFSEQEATALKEILVRFIREYGKKPAEQGDQEWLKQRFLEELPDLSEEDADRLSSETLDEITEYDQNLASLHSARAQGKTAEEWFAEKSQEAASGMSASAFGAKLTALDTALEEANAQMARAVTTQGGVINQQMNLDGFIAEQHHVNSFNLAATTSASPFHAEVCAPAAGEIYGKNSFDIVIRDQGGKIVHQYQCKYGADAEATIQMIRRGNYNNQTLLVPPEQVEQVQAAFPGKTVVAEIGGTDKVPVKSKALSKAEAKKLQLQTQENGAVQEVSWSAYDAKMVAKFVGKQAAVAGVLGAATATGFHIAGRLMNGEEIDAEEAVGVALETGADTGIKAAVAGAVKVGSEKGMIGLIPPGTSMPLIVNIVCVSIENIKILAKVAKGEITMREALDLMGCNTVSMVYGLSWGTTGAVIGAAALGWIPLVGPIIGGFVGGVVGYMAGSKFGQTIYGEVKKAVSTVKNTAGKLIDIGKQFAKSKLESVKRRLHA